MLRPWLERPWDEDVLSLDGAPALRLGLRMVKHLSHEGANRLLEARIAQLEERMRRDTSFQVSVTSV